MGKIDKLFYCWFMHNGVNKNVLNLDIFMTYFENRNDLMLET